MADRNTADPDLLPYFRPPLRNTVEPVAPAPTPFTPSTGGGLSDGDKGDVVVGSGGTTLTIDARAVTPAKLFAVATDKILGRATSGSGDVEALDCTAAGRALLDDADAAAQRSTLGLGTAATQSSSAFEPALGNPGADGYVLQSTAAGVRSWAAPGSGSGATIKSATVTVPGTGRLEHRQTIVDATVNASSKITVSLGAMTDADENDAEMLEGISLGAVPGSGQFDVVLGFREPQAGVIKLFYTV